MSMHFPTHSLVDTAAPRSDRATREHLRLGLLNTYSSRNLGDAAIARAISQMSGSMEVRASFLDEVPVPIPGVALSQDLSACARYVSVGGDIFNNARPHLLTRNFLSNVARLKAVADRTIVFGQTIPSSVGWLGLPILASALRRARAVVVRDTESFHLLRKNGVAAQLSHDAAFVLSPSDLGIWSAEHLFARQGLVSQKTILLSVRSFDSIYPHDQDKFQKSMAEMATRLIDRGHQVAVIVQSDVNESDSDNSVAAALQLAEPRLAILRLLDDDGISDPIATLIGALTIARSVVAVRYHAAVLRLVGGRQPYHLYYSRKGRDLHQRHGLTGGALETFDPVAAVADIEATADQDFNPTVPRADVGTSFAHAYRTLT